MPEGGYDIGTAWMTVIPSFRGVQRRVAREAKEWGREAGREFQQGFDAEVGRRPASEPGPSRQQSQRQGVQSGGAFADGFRRRVEAAARSLPPMRITAATSQAEQKLRDLREDLEDLSRKTVGVDVDAATANAQLSRLETRLQRLSAESPDVQVRADTATAAAQLGALQAQMSAIDGRDVNVRVDERGSMGALARLNRLGVAAMALGPAIIPVAAAASAALAGIGAGAVVGAAGLATMVVGFSGIGDAVGALSDQQTDAAKDAEAAAQRQASAAASVASAQRQVENAESSLANARADAAAGAERASTRVADARRGVQRAEEDAARSVEDATQRVAEARRGVVQAQEDAARDIAAAIERQQSAERSLVRAQEDSRRAALDLTQARREAREELADYNLTIQGASLGVEDAELALERARLRAQQAGVQAPVTLGDVSDAEWQRLLAEGWKGRAGDGAERLYAPAGGSLDAREADLAVRQAELRLKEARERNSDVREEAAAARKAGVEGSEQVVAAKQRLVAATQAEEDAERAAGQAAQDVALVRQEAATSVAEAQQAVTDAQEGLTRAQEDGAQRVADAQRRVADAVTAQSEQQRQSAQSIESALRQVEGAHASAATAAAGLAQAEDEVSTSTEKVNEAMAALSPTGKRFARFLFGLRDEWMMLKTAAQEGLLPGVRRGIEALLPSLPKVAGFLRDMGSALGDLAEQAGKSLAGPAWAGFFSYLGRVGPNMLTTLTRALGNLALGFFKLLEAFHPVSQQVLNGLLGMSRAFANWAAGLGENNSFQRFIGYLLDAGPRVAATIGSLFRALGTIAVGLAPLGDIVLRAVKAVADFIAGLNPRTITVFFSAIAAGYIVMQTLIAVTSFGAGIAIAMAGAARLARGAMLLWSAAVKVVTVTWRVLNAVMRLNPIGLIITGIMALVGVLTLAYRHHEGFRALVQHVWARIKGAASATVAWFTGTAWPAMQKAFRAIGAAATWLNKNAIQPAFRAIGRITGAYIMWWLSKAVPMTRVAFRAIGAIATWLWTNAIRPAFSSIGNISKSVFGWLSNTGWPMARTAFRAIGRAAGWLWTNALQPYFSRVLANWRLVFGWLRNTGWPWVRTAFQAIGRVAAWLWTNAIKPYFARVLANSQTVFGWILNTAWPWFRRAISNVGARAMWLWRNAIQPAFAGVRREISGAWDFVGARFADFRGGLDRLGDAFDATRRFITRTWDRIKDAVSGGITAVIRFVNDPLLKGLNKVLDWVDLGPIDPIRTSRSRRGGGAGSAVAAMASGGILPGYTPGRDVHSFMDGQGRSLHLSGGEAIMRPEWTRAVGADYIARANRDAAHGRFAAGGVLGGGPVGGNFLDWMSEKVKGAWSWAGDQAGTLRDLATNPVKTIKRIGESLLNGIGGGNFGQIATGALGKMWDGLAEKIKSGLVNYGVGGGPSAVGSGGWQNIVARIRKAGFNPTITSTVRRAGGRTLTGKISRHGLGQAVDMAPHKALQDWLWSVRNSFRELYLPDGRGWLLGKSRYAYPGAAATMANHMGSNAHIHAAYAQGGIIKALLSNGLAKPLVRDNGGPIPPGLSAVYNGTGRNEWALTDAQARQLGQGQGQSALVNQVHFHGTNPSDERRMYDGLNFELRRIRSGSLHERRAHA